MNETSYLIAVGAIVEKNGKILLVREGKGKAYGLWNTPAGRLNEGESAPDGAKREVKEETGFEVEINGLLGVYVYPSPITPNRVSLKIVFRSSIVGGKLDSPKDEFMDAKWFEPSEILAMKDSELRYIKREIEDFINGKNYPIDIIKYK